MQVADIIKTKGDRVVAIAPDRTVGEAASTLGRERIGAAVVQDKNGAVLGIISERDIVRAIAEYGAAALEMSVSDLMSRSVVTCTRASSTEDLLEQMIASQIRHLPVIEDSALVGIVSVSDVVKGVLSQLKWQNKALQEQVVTAATWSTDED